MPQPNMSSSLLWRREDTPEFQRHLQAYLDAYRPANQCELVLVQTLAAAMWQAHGAFLAERRLIVERMKVQRSAHPEAWRRSSPEQRIQDAWLAELGGHALQQIHRFHKQQHRIHRKAAQTLKQLGKMQAA